MSRNEAVTADQAAPAQRMATLLEQVAAIEDGATLTDLSERTGTPKPTAHRLLQQLEAAGLVQRGHGRRYTTGHRLRSLAEQVLVGSTRHGARHAVLRELVTELGEACNLTALSGDEVVYLDRVETPEPLRFHLSAGSRVPVHCSASGKMLMARMRPAQRRRLLEAAGLPPVTPHTVVDVEVLDRQVHDARRNGYALDEEEFLPGLFCVAVPVPRRDRPSHECLAVQAPLWRMDRSHLGRVLPVLRSAADRMGRLDTSPDDDNDNDNDTEDT